MKPNFTHFAFTDSVRRAQQHYGTRKAYARMESAAGSNLLSERESAFIKSRDGFYMATVGENGWPYVQFRGGPAGFLRVLDEETLGYADFRGNGQYISTGNLQSGGHAALILMDYPNRQRLKLWVNAEIKAAENDPELLRQLQAPNHGASIERLVLLRVQAYDWNCPRHITPRYTAEEFAAFGGDEIEAKRQ